MREDQNIEFKESWRDENLKWICGFANASGGKLIIGRNDQGDYVGLKETKKLLDDIPNKVRDILGVIVDVDLKKENGKDFLEIKVGQYPNPISYRGEYFYRTGSTNQQLKGAALAKFLLRKQGLHWDGIALQHVKISALDKDAINIFKNQAILSNRLDRAILKESVKSLLDKLHLLESNYLKRAALLLFHSEPEKFATGASIKIGFFETDAELRYQDEVHGPLLRQVDQTMEIIKAKYIKALISYKGLQRIETYPVPEVALREAILNAVVHKDYSTCIPIQISVYKDKLMIWNPGMLPVDWSIKSLLLKHSSQPFNPDIAAVFFRAGLIEAWGRGITKMLDSCREQGLSLPELKSEQNGIWVIFNFAQINYLSGNEKDSSVSPTNKIAFNTTNNTDNYSAKSFMEAKNSTTSKNHSVIAHENELTTYEKIIELLKCSPDLSAKKLSEILNITYDGIRYHLKRMKASGVIVHYGPKKTGYWKIVK
ncbi:MAG: putative DNA binding domain-containing protein [Candidatus Riflebacteria bacterium]|nr:putative DNA binding domain-containing protein [Candidatus Riflebacteria bacterium]